MKQVSYYILFIFAVVTLYGFAFTNMDDEEPKGKKVFVDSKCVGCHSVESQGIVSKSKKKNIIDFSNYGDSINVEFVKQFLKKEVKKDDVAHPVAFKGSDEELADLIAWFSTLKKPAEEVKEGN